MNRTANPYAALLASTPARIGQAYASEPMPWYVPPLLIVGGALLYDAYRKKGLFHPKGPRLL